MTTQTHAPEKSPPVPRPRMLAVIEIGTTSIRMAIAQANEQGGFEILDTLQQAVQLGRDTFTRGSIGPEAIEACVKVLRSYQKILAEVQITDPSRIAAIATSALSEASNRDEVLDRISIATGLDVEILEEAEISRYLFLAVRRLLKKSGLLDGANVLVAEVGGGSTDLLTLRKGRIGNAHVFKVGSYRFRKMLDDYNVPDKRLRHVMKTYVSRAVENIRLAVGRVDSPVFVALGGDARFAAGLLDSAWDKVRPGRISVAALSDLADTLLKDPPDTLVRKHHLSYPDAETVGPALAVYVGLANALKVREIHVSSATLRDGVLYEMLSQESWTREFREQILSSAFEIGRHYRMEQAHSRFVAAYARRIFMTLQEEHHLGPRHEVVLALAALLHDIGHFVSNRSHHKHSMYLILNSDVFGLGSRDLTLAALVARYHRKALPRPEHEVYSTLDRANRVIVSKLAAILRVADGLDKNRSLHGLEIDIRLDPGRLVLAVHADKDLLMEKHAVEQAGIMFERVYGLKVILTQHQGTDHEPKR